MSNKSIRIFLARHLPQAKRKGIAWHRGAPLLGKSYALARKIRGVHLAGQTFRFTGCSPVKRAVQSLLAFVPDLEEVETIDVLGPLVTDDLSWNNLFANAGNCTLAECCAFNFPFLKQKGEAIYAELEELVQAFSPGDQAFLVAHGPLVEMTMMVAQGLTEPIDDMGKGEIAVFEFDAETRELIGVTRLPVPE